MSADAAMIPYQDTTKQHHVSTESLPTKSMLGGTHDISDPTNPYWFAAYPTNQSSKITCKAQTRFPSKQPNLRNGIHRGKRGCFLATHRGDSCHAQQGRGRVTAAGLYGPQ